MEANVIIVGGGPAGVITALTAKSVYPEKSVCVIKEIGDGVIPCAIPYMIHTLSDTKQNAAGDMPLENAGNRHQSGKGGRFRCQSSHGYIGGR
jgi:NADH oxidase (H2O2-forming)